MNVILLFTYYIKKRFTMKKLNNQSGFTLIELMIVIAIIAILMSYAIPAYRNYSIYAKRGECNAIVDGLKTRMLEFRAKNIDWPNSVTEAGLSGGTQGKYTNSISFTDTGTVQCSMSAVSGGKTITWTATLASLSNWTCIDSITTIQWNICP